MKGYHYSILGWLCIIIRYTVVKGTIVQLIIGLVGLGFFTKDFINLRREGIEL